MNSCFRACLRVESQDRTLYTSNDLITTHRASISSLSLWQRRQSAPELNRNCRTRSTKSVSEANRAVKSAESRRNCAFHKSAPISPAKWATNDFPHDRSTARDSSHVIAAIKGTFHRERGKTSGWKVLAESPCSSRKNRIPADYVDVTAGFGAGKVIKRHPIYRAELVIIARMLLKRGDPVRGVTRRWRE